MKTLLMMLLASFLIWGCEEKDPKVAPPVEEGVADPAEELMEDGHEAMHGDSHDEMHGDSHDEMHGDSHDEMHHDMHGDDSHDEMADDSHPAHDHADTVEVASDGTKFDPPIESSQVPEGAWYCDMGTVHYARMTEGDGKCPVCGMKLTEK